MRYNKEQLDKWIKEYGSLKEGGMSLKDLIGYFLGKYGLKDISSIRKNYDLLKRVNRVEVKQDDNCLKEIAKAKSDLLVNRKINVKQQNTLNNLANVVAYRDMIIDTIKNYRWKTYENTNGNVIDNVKFNNSGVYIISDEHFKGNCDIKHLNNIYDTIKNDIEKEEYDSVELWYLGDGVDGLIHSGSLASNDGAIIPMCEYINIVIERVNKIPQVKSIKFITKSNHTQTRPLGTNRNELAKEDLGFAMANMLRLGLRQDIKLITDDIIIFKYNNLNIALLHGHQPYAKSKAKMIEYWSSKYGVVPDMTIMGHYHTFKVNEFGDNKWLVVAPTAKNFNGDFENENGYISNNQILKLEFNKKIPRFEIIKIGE